jgi:hypothetical protein
MYYKVVGYVRAEPEPEECIYFASKEEANTEMEHLELMNTEGENIYKIEEIDPEEIPDGSEIVI